MSEYTNSLLPYPLGCSTPKPTYDVVIIGGGGHGLATAYYLATRHGMTDVAVVEADYIGSGNTGRNTTIIRANYGLAGTDPLLPARARAVQRLEAETALDPLPNQGHPVAGPH